MKSLAAAGRLWLRCFNRAGFDAITFLGLSHRGILLGDLAASEHLRWVRAGAGQLTARPGLFLMLVDCVFICNLSYDELVPPLNAAVMVHEPTYRHAVYKRALRDRGLTVIEPKWYEASGFEFIGATQEIRNAFGIRPATTTLNHQDREAVQAYMSGRLANPGKYLRYLADGFNNNQRDHIAADNGDILALDDALVHVVIFLHSFDDNQYMYGCDGFTDLVDWTLTTIRMCSANRNIGTVMIKTHPACSTENFHNNLRAVAHIRKECEHFDRVVWLETDASLRALARAGMVIGITHHGSVAEELVFLGIPVIAFRNASWREGYSFVRGWTSTTDYLDMLRTLSARSYLRPSTAERESLYAYIKECRLRPGQGEFDYQHEYRTWLAANGSDHYKLGEDALIVEMDAQSHDDALRFIDFLAQRDADNFRQKQELAEVSQGI